MFAPRFPRRRWLAPSLAAAGAAALVAGCGAAAPTGTSTSPASPTRAAVELAVRLSDAGCTPSSFALHPGTIIFTVTNGGSTSVEEMEIDDQQGHVRGDVEGVKPGETRTFVVDLTAGTYAVRCPQDAPTAGTLTIR